MSKLLKQYAYEYRDDCSPYTLSLGPGMYLFQVWGAAGGGWSNYGKGGYVEGRLTVTKLNTFYIYVGGQGKSQNGSKGGGQSCGGGGRGGNGGNYDNYTALFDASYDACGFHPATSLQKTW